MIIKLIFWTISLCLLSGCSDTLRGYFKRSANNKLFDTQGFRGKKRRPLYNQKYISRAKRNIATDDLDEDDEDDMTYYERKMPSKVYKQMYIDMLEYEQEKKRNRLNDYRLSNIDDEYNDEYTSLKSAKNRVMQAPAPNNKALEKEITEIKNMLKKTREDLTKYKCTNSVMPTEIEDITPLPSKSSNKLQEKFIHEKIFKDA